MSTTRLGDLLIVLALIQLVTTCAVDATEMEPATGLEDEVITDLAENEPNQTLAITESADPITQLVSTIAASARVPVRLVTAIIVFESNGNPKALSEKGAMGLMQLMPATAERFGVSDPWDPEQNIYGGTQFLRFLLDKYKGNLAFVLAAYNAGENAVDEHGGIPPYEQTREYVNKVLAFIHQ